MPCVKVQSQRLRNKNPFVWWTVQIYKEILELPAWKQNRGRDFVFFFPWSLTHVLDYEYERPNEGIIQEYLDIVCKQMSSALQITVENLQVTPAPITLPRHRWIKLL